MKFLGKLFISLLVLGTLTACSTGKSTPSSTPNVPIAITKNITLYFVSDTPKGFLLSPEIQRIIVSGSLLISVMSDLISGKILPIDPDYFNLWKFGSQLNSISILGTTATVDFVKVKLNVGAEIEQRAIDQLIWTLTGLDSSIKNVRFTIAGKSIETLAGHVDTRGIFKREPSYKVLTSLAILSLSQNQLVANPIVITGQACTFEAAVPWELIRDGVTPSSYARGTAMAKISCPSRSAWSVVLPTLPLGKYTFVVRDLSAKDGSVIATDNKDFTVR